MGGLSIVINGHNYRIACDDGEEKRLQELATFVEERVVEMISSVGQVGDDRILVMASLLIADELYDAREELEALRSASAGGAPAADREAVDDRLAKGMDTLAQRIESIASRLK